MYNAWMDEWMDEWMDGWMCVCMCFYIYIYTYIHIYTPTQNCICIYAYMQICKCIYIYVFFSSPRLKVRMTCLQGETGGDLVHAHIQPDRPSTKAMRTEAPSYTLRLESGVRPATRRERCVKHSSTHGGSVCSRKARTLNPKP